MSALAVVFTVIEVLKSTFPPATRSPSIIMTALPTFTTTKLNKPSILQKLSELWSTTAVITITPFVVMVTPSITQIKELETGEDIFKSSSVKPSISRSRASISRESPAIS